MNRFFDFLGELQKLGVHYRIEYHTASEFGSGYRTVTIHVSASGNEAWEVDFHDDGTVDVERFVSTGGIQDADLESLIEELRSDRD